MRDPIYARIVIEINGHSAQEVERARRMLNALEQSQTNQTGFWRPDYLQDTIARVPPTWRLLRCTTRGADVHHSRQLGFHDVGVGTEVAYP